METEESRVSSWLCSWSDEELAQFSSEKRMVAGSRPRHPAPPAQFWFASTHVCAVILLLPGTPTSSAGSATTYQSMPPSVCFRGHSDRNLFRRQRKWIVLSSSIKCAFQV